MHRVRRRLIGARTALVNQIRGLVAEYGVLVPQQVSSLRRTLPRLVEDLTNDLTPLARTTFTALSEELRAVDVRGTTVDRELKEYCAQDERCQRGVGVEASGVGRYFSKSHDSFGEVGAGRNTTDRGERLLSPQ
ncbi:MAG: hypothetical protein H8K06_17510 [Nitrospira sp.]|uniref:Transposase n=1 Tax=Nitrospira defluvii TaxID=330214 RepID=A0ABN7MAS7_9BACT|nr:hypothetical protein [Nitrospira defluvii]MCS6328865.1 hypothetical protein [Nitrospira sp.]CAE6790102.1 hypothetical protein NSPZN2_50304 [Nitrospira defluvii]